MPSQPFSGVLVPVLTPFTPSGEPDAGRFVAFCRWLLDQGAGGLAIFGTTSEANSMSPGERMELLDRLIEAGIPAAEADAGDRCLCDDRCRNLGAARGRSRLRRGADAAALLLQGGQRRRHLRVHFRRHRQGRLAGAEALSLPHPANGGGRVLARPGRPLDHGLSGDGGRVEGQLGRLEQHGGIARPLSGFRGFPGLRGLSARWAQKGAVGCITASGNVNVPGIKKVYDNWRGPQADALQAEITTLRNALQAYPMVPALKRVVAHYHNDPNWAAVRPPLVPLSQAQSTALIADLDKLGFTLGERPQAKAA